MNRCLGLNRCGSLCGRGGSALHDALVTTVAGAKPWAGMVVKSVALFDEWVTPSDLANYKFPAQGAVRPVDPDRYAIEPVASWVNDFKTTEKGDYTLSVSGTTAAKDDTFGGTLTIGDAAAVIDTTAASSANMTVLIKYRAASSVTTAPVAAFGGMSAVGLDVGVYTKSDKTLAVYRNFSTDNGKPYDFATAPTLSANGGYVLCARNNFKSCMAYVGDSLDAMTGGEVTDGNIQFSNVPLTKLGIGGNSDVEVRGGRDQDLHEHRDAQRGRHDRNHERGDARGGHVQARRVDNAAAVHDRMRGIRQGRHACD